MTRQSGHVKVKLRRALRPDHRHNTRPDRTRKLTRVGDRPTTGARRDRAASPYPVGSRTLEPPPGTARGPRGARRRPTPAALAGALLPPRGRSQFSLPAQDGPVIAGEFAVAYASASAPMASTTPLSLPVARTRCPRRPAVGPCPPQRMVLLHDTSPGISTCAPLAGSGCRNRTHARHRLAAATSGTRHPTGPQCEAET